MSEYEFTNKQCIIYLAQELNNIGNVLIQAQPFCDSGETDVAKSHYKVAVEQILHVFYGNSVLIEPFNISLEDSIRNTSIFYFVATPQEISINSREFNLCCNDCLKFDHSIVPKVEFSLPGVFIGPHKSPTEYLDIFEFDSKYGGIDVSIYRILATIMYVRFFEIVDWIKRSHSKNNEEPVPISVQLHLLGVNTDGIELIKTRSDGFTFLYTPNVTEN